MANSVEVTAVKFSCIDVETTRRLSVVEVTHPDVLDNLSRPIPGGLYDPAMGPITRQGRCATCSLSSKDCPGHLGHMELPIPVYNPLLFSELYRLLRCMCFMCHHLRFKNDGSRLMAKMRFLDAVMVHKALTVDEMKVPAAASRKAGGAAMDEDDESEASQEALDELVAEAKAVAAQRLKRRQPRVKNAQCEKIRRETTRQREPENEASALPPPQSQHADASLPLVPSPCPPGPPLRLKRGRCSAAASRSLQQDQRHQDLRVVRQRRVPRVVL